ncbi:transposase [Micromonospora sp. WMMA1363]|uniref:transposase n=1 Tax=Micromonospora sp. WMMA1363 TaxID=3053985 RepID=UPI00259C90D2|nr:transposase [Micromonospora sp. WMMA1363]MDM4723564.1 transposase [Micromonospora sp. WMMA1363]
MKKIPGLAGRVRVGAPDASLTPVSGVVAVAELVGRLGVTAALDDAVGRIKQRDRGLSGGEFLVAVAQAQMCGAQFWVGLDRRRADTAGEALSAVPTPAASTAVELASRFGPAQVAGIEEGIGEIACRVVGLLPAARRAVLRTGGATIDLDGTDVEVYGAKKEGIAYSYKGARAGRPHVATWAEAGVVTAADLLAGDEDPRPGAGSLIERSVATLNAAGVTARPKVRGDVGYFAKDIAQAAVEAGCDFSLGVTRNPAVWRAAAAIPDDAWRKAERMKGAQVAVCDYAPAGWPPATMTVVRRVKVHATDISADPRARRRRTIPKAQLTLALDGLVGHVYAYSFIATNLDVSTPAKTVAVEAWHRMRTDIEDRIRDAKHGAALRHLPSGSRAANTVWMWGRCWPSTCPPGCRNWPASTTATDEAATTSAPCATG